MLSESIAGLTLSTFPITQFFSVIPGHSLPHSVDRSAGLHRNRGARVGQRGLRAIGMHVIPTMTMRWRYRSARRWRIMKVCGSHGRVAICIVLRRTIHRWRVRVEMALRDGRWWHVHRRPLWRKRRIRLTTMWCCLLRVVRRRG
jgi:hypothetical protein